jgi:hypothetical protein
MVFNARVQPATHLRQHAYAVRCLSSGPPQLRALTESAVGFAGYAGKLDNALRRFVQCTHPDAAIVQTSASSTVTAT